MQNWKQLSKFKLSALVVASSAAGFVAGSDERVDWGKLAWTALGTMGAAASANTLNQVRWNGPAQAEHISRIRCHWVHYGLMNMQSEWGLTRHSAWDVGLSIRVH